MCQRGVKEMVMPLGTIQTLREVSVVEPVKALPPPSTRTEAPSARQLLAFYLSLSPWERIDRFGCAMSDDAVRAWRRGLNPWYSKSILWPQARQPVGIVEIFGSPDREWICPEMVVYAMEAAAPNPLHNLFAEGLAAARRLGASYVRLYVDRSGVGLRRLATLHGGELDCDSGLAVVPCGPLSFM
jgi:hypothetical protein